MPKCLATSSTETARRGREGRTALSASNEKEYISVGCNIHLVTHGDVYLEVQG